MIIKFTRLMAVTQLFQVFDNFIVSINAEIANCNSALPANCVDEEHIL